MAKKQKYFEKLEEGTVIVAVHPYRDHVAYFTTVDEDKHVRFEVGIDRIIDIDLTLVENVHTKIVKGKYNWIKIGAVSIDYESCWNLYLDPRDIFSSNEI
jgi:hypothetical protein